MLDQVLKIFEIKPDYDLNIMKQGQDLYDVTSRVLVGMREVLNDGMPDVMRFVRCLRNEFYRCFILNINGGTGSSGKR